MELFHNFEWNPLLSDSIPPPFWILPSIDGYEKVDSSHRLPHYVPTIAIVVEPILNCIILIKLYIHDGMKSVFLVSFVMTNRHM